MQLIGFVYKKGETVQKTEKFSVRDLVIERPDKSNMPIKFQLKNDKCKLIDLINIGDEVNVRFDVVGNEWKGAYYVNLELLEIQVLSKASTVSDQIDNTQLNTDDLPF